MAVVPLPKVFSISSFGRSKAEVAISCNLVHMGSQSHSFSSLGFVEFPPSVNVTSPNSSLINIAGFVVRYQEQITELVVDVLENDDCSSVQARVTIFSHTHPSLRLNPRTSQMDNKGGQTS